MNLALEIGANIRRIRNEKLKETLEQLSERAGIAASFLAMIERGKRIPSLSTLWRIATALGVPVSVLLNIKGPESSGQ